MGSDFEVDGKLLFTNVVDHESFACDDVKLPELHGGEERFYTFVRRDENYCKRG